MEQKIMAMVGTAVALVLLFSLQLPNHWIAIIIMLALIGYGLFYVPPVEEKTKKQAPKKKPVSRAKKKSFPKKKKATKK